MVTDRYRWQRFGERERYVGTNFYKSSKYEYYRRILCGDCAAAANVYSKIAANLFLCIVGGSLFQAGLSNITGKYV